MSVLNCQVPPELWARWSAHFAPPTQPFFLTHDLASALPAWPRWTRDEFRALQLPLTLADTFTTYAVHQEVPWVFLLSEAMFAGLPLTTQQALLLA